VKRRRRRVVASLGGQHARSGQRARTPHGDLSAQARERLFEPRAALGEVAPHLPEAPEARREAELGIRAVGIVVGPAHGGPQVVLVRGQALDPLCLDRAREERRARALHEVDEPVAMT
jgi:hypothetical protein